MLDEKRMKQDEGSFPSFLGVERMEVGEKGETSRKIERKNWRGS